MKKYNLLVVALAFFCAGSCQAVRECVISVPTQDTSYTITFNTDSLREADRVLKHQQCYLPNSSDQLHKHLKDLCNWAKTGKPVDQNKFSVLKKTDWSGTYGSLVVKLPDQAHVAKLFRVDPSNFGMGSGLADLGMWLVNRVSRFMLGFTRLSNRARLVSWLKKTEAGKEFSDLFVLPRKKLWIPENAVWITISWSDLNGKKCSVKIPDTYIVVGDWCEKSRDLTKQESKRVFELIKKLPGFITIDPNPTNFFVNKNNKIVLIDTENIDFTVGAHIQPVSYSDWFVQLVVSSLNTALVTACCELG